MGTYKDNLAVLQTALANSKDPAVVAAIEALTKGRDRQIKEVPFLGHFVKTGQRLHEDEAFKLYHVGRQDAYWKIADAIKLSMDKATRKWIFFDKTTCEYVYVGIGATPPSGYTGYVPKKERPVK